MTITVDITELDLICEALALRASRHQSMARANPRNAAPHDRKAAAMLKLKIRLQRDTK